jgi:hypothetical protein
MYLPQSDPVLPSVQDPPPCHVVRGIKKRDDGNFEDKAESSRRNFKSRTVNF